MPITKFLDPKNDQAFKRIFGTEKNKDILIHFLNDIIAFKQSHPITDVTFLKTVLDPDTAAHKTSIVDVLCKDDLGNQYIVELQVAKEKSFTKRAQYYAAKAYSSQMKVGGMYDDLKEIIFIAISDFIMFANKQAWKSDHIILDKDTHDNDLKDFSFTFLELPKFTKSKEELSTIIDRWAYFFIHAQETKEEDLQAIIGDDVIIKRAYDELSRFGWNEEEIRGYEQAEKYAGTYRASMEQKYDEGLAKGEKIGEERGRQEGELQKERQLVLSMHRAGADLAFIQQVTGLAERHIEEIIENSQ